MRPVADRASLGLRSSSSGGSTTDEHLRRSRNGLTLVVFCPVRPPFLHRGVQGLRSVKCTQRHHEPTCNNGKKPDFEISLAE